MDILSKCLSVLLEPNSWNDKLCKGRCFFVIFSSRVCHDLTKHSISPLNFYSCFPSCSEAIAITCSTYRRKLLEHWLAGCEWGWSPMPCQQSIVMNWQFHSPHSVLIDLFFTLCCWATFYLVEQQPAALVLLFPRSISGIKAFNLETFARQMRERGKSFLLLQVPHLLVSCYEIVSSVCLGLAPTFTPFLAQQL